MSTLINLEARSPPAAESAAHVATVGRTLASVRLIGATATAAAGLATERRLAAKTLALALAVAVAWLEAVSATRYTMALTVASTVAAAESAVSVAVTSSDALAEAIATEAAPTVEATWLREWVLRAEDL